MHLKLKKMGLAVDRSKVMTSGEATCEKILEMYPGKRAFGLGNEFLVNDFKELLEVMLNENLSEFQYVIDDGKWKVVQK